MGHTLLIYPLIHGHLGGICLLGLMNTAVVNSSVQPLFLLSILLSIYPEVELLDHTIIYFYYFEEPPHYFPQQLHHFTFPPAEHKSSGFSTPSPTLVTVFSFVFFLIIAILMVSHCGFDLLSLMISDAKTISMGSLATWTSALDKGLFKSFVHFFYLSFCRCCYGSLILS